jgi:hypothetical protein
MIPFLVRIVNKQDHQLVGWLLLQDFKICITIVLLLGRVPLRLVLLSKPVFAHWALPWCTMARASSPT